MFKYLILINLIILNVNCQLINDVEYLDNELADSNGMNYDPIRPNHRNHYRNNRNYGGKRSNRFNDYQLNEFENYRKSEPYNEMENSNSHRTIPLLMKSVLQRTPSLRTSNLRSRKSNFGMTSPTKTTLPERNFVNDLLDIQSLYTDQFRKFMRLVIRNCMKYEKGERLDEEIETTLPEEIKLAFVQFFCSDNEIDVN